MTDDCPKCGGSFAGPRYSPGQGCACHPECLYYSCQRCGYTKSEPVNSKCHDPARKALERLAKGSRP